MSTTEKQSTVSVENGVAEALEKVPVFMPRDAFNINDVYVSVNNKDYQIQRGKQVMVPRYVYEALRESNEQDIRASEMIHKLSEDYQKSNAGR